MAAEFTFLLTPGQLDQLLVGLGIPVTDRQVRVADPQRVQDFMVQGLLPKLAQQLTRRLQERAAES